MPSSFPRQCHRSISAAARNLFTSTSNISKLISNLEEELGYTIFNRTANGLVPTAPGREFIMHATTILKEYGENEHLRDTYNSKKLSIENFTSSYCSNAFADLAVVAGTSTDDSNSEHHFRHKGITLKKIGEVPTVMYIAKVHPLLAKYENDSDILHAAYHYPYIEYNDDMLLSPHPIRPYINTENVIKINERDWRYKIIKMTNGFASGTVLPSDVKIYDWLREITIPQGELSFFLAWRNGEEQSPMCKEFTDILTSKLKKDGRYCESLK